MNYCKCQCGKLTNKTWFHGHNRKGTTFKLSEDAKEKCRLAKLGPLNPRFGKSSTTRGRTHTEEEKQKIREARAKQIITESHREKISEGNKRAYREGRRSILTHPFYIDGRSSGKSPIKKTFLYKLWREKVFERDDYTCQICGIRGGEIQADHIKPQSVYPELRFELSNGRTLCRPCHMETDTWGMRHWNNKKNTTNISLCIGTQS